MGPYWAGTETSVGTPHRPRLRSVFEPIRIKDTWGYETGNATVAAPPGSLGRKAQKLIHQLQPRLGPATTALPATPTSAQASYARRCTGGAGSVLWRPGCDRGRRLPGQRELPRAAGTGGIRSLEGFPWRGFDCWGRPLGVSRMFFTWARKWVSQGRPLLLLRFLNL